ncbi:hypothetical protein EV714DRAFT_246440 [Schizophyllum commune]
MAASTSSAPMVQRRVTVSASNTDSRYSYYAYRTRSISCAPRSLDGRFGPHALQRERCIVLCVEDCSYRVHHSVLVGNSRSFEKRLAHHRDDSDDIKNWGVEDIVLPGDSKQDWDAMLDALYDSDSYFETLSAQPLDKSLPTLAGLLQLAHKYNMDIYEQKITSIIASYFPSPSPNSKGVAWPSLAEATTVIRLAHQTHATSLLRPAYLIVAAHAAESNKSIVHDLDILTSDKLSICGGMLALLKAQRAHMFRFFTRFTPPARCQNGGRCCPQAHAQRYHDAPERVWLIVDEPLAWLGEGDPAPLCDVCYASVSATFAEGSRAVWARLDKLFKLY